ncbi:hypothetical protein [Paenibacillus sp. UNC451MF]|nr:hypothetical protein [Paenibacillus sp. UNC451MF]
MVKKNYHSIFRYGKSWRLDKCHDIIGDLIGQIGNSGQKLCERIAEDR